MLCGSLGSLLAIMGRCSKSGRKTECGICQLGRRRTIEVLPIMNADLASKLAQVIEQIPGDVLYDFLCDYAQSHEELAMALVSRFWKAAQDDYRSMV